MLYIIWLICCIQNGYKGQINLQMLQQQNLMDECSEQTSGISAPILNKIEHESHRFRNLVTQLRISKKRSVGESAGTPFNIQNQCEISNIEPVSQKLDKNSFELDLPNQLPIPIRKLSNTIIPFNMKNKMSDRQIGDRGLKYRPRGAINGRDDIKVRNLSQIHKKIVGSVEKSRVHVNDKEHEGLENALKKLELFDHNPEQEMNNLLLTQSKFRITSPAKKAQNIQLSRTRHNETQRPPRPSLQPSRIKNSSIKHQKMLIQPKQLKQFLVSIAQTKYPTPDSSPSRIYEFFIKISTHFGIQNQFNQPLIKRYRNCIYFGHKVPQYGVYMGFVFYYRKALYYGEFQRGRKNGYGIEIDMEDPNNICMWKGTFSNGKKTGYFQLISNKIQYNGALVNSYFDGQGQLKTIGYSTYKGTFQAGMKHGFGVETFQNKKSLNYKGQYFENKFEGKGQLQGPNYFYKGYFRNNRQHGEGFQRNNQFQYEGQFKDGKRSGIGTLKFKTGEQFKGLFQNGEIVKQSPIQISRGNNNGQSLNNQYVKNIKIQSTKKYEQQSSFASSPILSQQSKIRLPAKSDQKHPTLENPSSKLYNTSKKQINPYLFSNTMPLGNNHIDITNYESRIVPLDKHLSKRLSSLHEENQNQEGTIDNTKYQINNMEYQQRDKGRTHGNAKPFGLFKVYQVQNSNNMNLQEKNMDKAKYDRIKGMSLAYGDQDGEEQPLGIKLAPRQ